MLELKRIESSYKTLLTIAFAFNIVSMVSVWGIFVIIYGVTYMNMTEFPEFYDLGKWLVIVGAVSYIGLAWKIPMTISLRKMMRKEPSKKMVGFGVCELIFVHIVSGILVLVANGKVDQYNSIKQAVIMTNDNGSFNSGNSFNN